MSINLTEVLTEWSVTGGILMPWISNDNKFMIADIRDSYTRGYYNLDEGVVGLDSIENRISVVIGYYMKHYRISDGYESNYAEHMKRNIHLNVFV